MNPTLPHPYRAPHHLHPEQGAILVVTLIMLVLLTIIGVTSMRSTVFEERMAGNLRDQQSAFQAAEAALRHAEELVSNPFSNFTPQPSIPRPAGGEMALWNNALTWCLTTAEAGCAGRTIIANEMPTTSAIQAMVSESPRFVVEIAGTLEGVPNAVDEEITTVNVFRITARARGTTPESMVILQSVFRP